MTRPIVTRLSTFSQNCKTGKDIIFNLIAKKIWFACAQLLAYIFWKKNPECSVCWAVGYSLAHWLFSFSKQYIW